MIPVEVFLVVVPLAYFLGRHSGKKAIKNQFKDFFK
jgi:hypothetical protein